MDEWTADQRRSVVLEYQLRVGVHTIAGVCERHGLTPAGFRRLRNQVGPVYATHHELVLAAVRRGARTVRAIAETVDYLDHVRHPDAVIAGWLGELEARGLVRREGETWSAPEARFPMAGARLD